MDELHEAIARFLRGQRRATEREAAVDSGDHPLRGLRTGAYILRCHRCGHEIGAIGARFDVAVLVAARRCLDCYLAEAA